MDGYGLDPGRSLARGSYTGGRTLPSRSAYWYVRRPPDFRSRPGAERDRALKTMTEEAPGLRVTWASTALAVVMAGAAATHLRFVGSMGWPALPLGMMTILGVVVALRKRAASAADTSTAA